MASSDAFPGSRRRRPLSPHLSIYRPTMTMAMSIAHRISGMALYVGVLLLAWFLIAASADASTFAVFSGFLSSFIYLTLGGAIIATIGAALGAVR